MTWLNVTSVDSIVNEYLIASCGCSPETSTAIGLVAASSYHFFGSISYPSIISCGLRISKLGKTSVRYEVGIFEQGKDEVKAVGNLTHVFVEKSTGRPLPGGMPAKTRDGLARLLPLRSKL